MVTIYFHGGKQPDPDRSINLLTTPVVESEFIGTPYPAPGERVRLTTSAPPWMVVDHSVEQIIVPKWPVRLWQVEDLEPAPPSDQIGDAYTRVVAVTMIDEVPAWKLFGDAGSEIAAVIDNCAELESEKVAQLAAATKPGIDARYEELVEVELGATQRWPGNKGASLAYQAICDRAKSLDPSLFVFDEIDEVDVLSDPAWIAASHAAVHRIFAVSATTIDQRDEQDLSHAWLAAFGS